MNQPELSRTADQPAGPRRSAWRRWLRRLWTAFNVLVLLLLVLMFSPVLDWLGAALTHVDAPVRSDFIVVLGGDDERAVEAARLYRDGWAPKVIISSTPENARDLAIWARMYGIPEADLLLDSQAVRTASHPQTVAQVHGVQKTSRLMIVTSRFHTSRSRACFLAAGYRNVCMRSPEWTLGRPHMWGLGVYRRARDLVPVVYESLAWAVYEVRGWL